MASAGLPAGPRAVTALSHFDYVGSNQITLRMLCYEDRPRSPRPKVLGRSGRSASRLVSPSRLRPHPAEALESRLVANRQRVAAQALVLKLGRCWVGCPFRRALSSPMSHHNRNKAPDT